MSEQRKAIIIATGMDNVQLLATLKDTEVATGSSLDQIKALYTKFSDQQALQESRKNAESLAKLKANDDLKLAEMERFFAAQKGMYEERDAVAAVGQGSIPAGWVGTAGKGAKGAKEAEQAERDAKKVTGSLKEAGHAFRELGKILMELSGAAVALTVLRSVGTALRAIALLGGGAVTVIAAGAIAIKESLGMRKELNTMGQEPKESKETREKQHKELSKYVTDLGKSGMITPDQQKDILNRLRGGDTESVIAVQNRLRKMFPNGTGNVDMNNKFDTIARQGMNPEQRWSDTTMRLERVMAEMNKLDPKSAVYKQKHGEYEKLLKQQEEDGKAIARWTSSVQQAKAKAAELTKEISTEQQRQETVYPSLEELARVQSPQGQMARQISSLQQDQLKRRSFGDILGANYDASQIGILRGTLASQGVIAPNPQLDEIKSHLKDLNGKMAAIQNGILKVNIAEVSGD
jgi:hypothetical protein